MLSLLASVLMAAGVSTCEPSVEVPAFRYYYRERRPLVLDGTRVAIHATRDGALPWSSAALPPAGVERRASNRWYTVRLGVERGWPEMQQLVRTLAGLDQGWFDFAAPVFRGEDRGWFFPTSRLLVGVVNPEAGSRLPLKQGERVEREWAGDGRLLRIQTVERNGFVMLERARCLLWDSDVREDVVLAEPDMVFTIRDPVEVCVSAASADSDWGLKALRLPEACTATGACGDDVRVVVLDDGIERGHPGLSGKFLGKDFTNTPAKSAGEPASECDQHGTTVAGALAGVDRRAPGAAPGVELASARIVAHLDQQPCSSEAESESSWTMEALGWARTIHARITVNSGAYDYDSAAVAWQYLLTHMRRGDFLGLAHFAAAGNSGSSTVAAPARFPAVNGVGGTNRLDCDSTYTNYGCDVAMAAPGVDIPVTDLVGDRGHVPGDYTTLSGTSYATPYAAGVAALLLGVDSNLTACQLDAHLRASARSLHSCTSPDILGVGLLDACEAIGRLGKRCR